MLTNEQGFLKELKHFKKEILTDKTVGLYDGFKKSIKEHLLCVNSSTFKAIALKKFAKETTLESVKKETLNEIKEKLTDINYENADSIQSSFSKFGGPDANVAAILDNTWYGPVKSFIRHSKLINDTILKRIDKEEQMLTELCEIIENLIKKISDYKPSELTSQYQLVGDSEEYLRKYYLIKNNFTLDENLNHKNEMLKFDFADDEDYKNEIDKYYISLEKEIYKRVINFLKSKLISTILVLTYELYSSDLLPEDLRTKDAAYTIASYFKNRRADNPKEAFNLFYHESLIKEKLEEIKAEARQSREEIRSVANNLLTEYKNQAKISFAFAKKTGKAIKDLEDENKRLVDEHNKLVDKHNALVDELSK